MLRFYVKIRRFIINHSFGAFFFSHGGVHILAAFIMIILSLYFYFHSIIPEPVYKQIDITIEDSFHKGADRVEINLGASLWLEDAMGYSTGLDVTFWYNPIDTSKLVRGKDYLKRTIYTDTQRSYLPSIYPDQNIQNRDTSHIYRKATLSISTKNVNFIPNIDTLKRGDTYRENLIIPTDNYIDSLSKSHLKQITYCNMTQQLCVSQMIWGDFLGFSHDNPYYHILVNIDDKGQINDDVDGYVKLQIGAKNSEGIPTNPLNIIQCYPTSYTYNPIEGLKLPINDVIKNGGIYLMAEDLSKKRIADRKAFLNSVLVGASLAFFLDIIVNLIIKWRNLAIRKKHTTKKH